MTGNTSTMGGRDKAPPPTEGRPAWTSPWRPEWVAILAKPTRDGEADVRETITSRFNHRLRKEAENTRGGKHVATAEIEAAMIEGQKCLMITSRHSEHLTKALRTLAREDAGPAAGDGEKESSLDIREDTKENGAPALTISVYTEFSVYTKQTCSAFVPGRAGVIAEDNLRTHLPAGDFPGSCFTLLGFAKTPIAEDNLRTHLPAGDFPGSCFTLLGFAIGGRPNPDGNRLLQSAAIPRCHLPVCVPHYPAVTFQEATMCG